MKRIETRTNEFVQQFRALLDQSFPPVIGFEVDYFLGEEANGTRGLYFEVRSVIFGSIFSRFFTVQPHQTVADVEEEFTDRIVNDLVLAGVTFLNVEAFKEKRSKEIDNEVKAVPFRSSFPQRPLHSN